MQKSYRKYALLFILPVIITFLIAVLIPFFMGIYLSFFKFKTLRNAQFIGIQNYLYVFSDKAFLRALWFTIRVSFVCVLSVNIFAFVLALLLTRGLKATNFFRTLFYMPNLVVGIILGYIWQLMINGILIRWTGHDITYSAAYGYCGLTIVYNWQNIGYIMVIYIAGIQSIPKDLFEAAEIDGANSFHMLKNVTLPLVMNSITICLFLSLKDTFLMYSQNLSLTGGAPANTTAMLAMDIYNTYYSRVGFGGVGQAKAVIFTVIVCVIVMIQLSITRKQEVEM